ALRPLERLYQHGDAMVRAAVLRGLGQMFYKRSFHLLSRGLVDPDPQVRDAALEALRRLHFPHAFDALVRIFRESAEDRVRATALESIGEIGSVEAGEFLINVVRYESEVLRRAAQRLLGRFENPEVLAMLRSYVENETGPSRAALEQVVQ